MQSPLFKNIRAKKTNEYTVDEIVLAYHQQFSIDVSRFFQGISLIHLYECEFSGYQFFYPFSLAGDDRFYQQLEKFSWYYMPWKWEHEIAKKIARLEDEILETGSGGLGFLSKMTNLGYKVTGLELNTKSVKKAQALNLKVYNENVENFAAQSKKRFDIVCSFQVLEHVADVHSFIKSQLECLKIGGKMIISVPNNMSFIKYSEGGVLNKPPHHMGLWNEKSLRSLESLFSLKVETIYYEPLQEYHFDWYLDSVLMPLLDKNRFFKKGYNRVINRKLEKKLLRTLKRFIKGHTMLITFKKNS